MRLTRRQLLVGGALLCVVGGQEPRDPLSLSWDHPQGIFVMPPDDLRRDPDMPLPAKVLGVYWTGWGGGTPITALPASYNLVYLFAAHAAGAPGAVAWGYAPVPVADLKAMRAKGKQIVLSTGGAGSGIRFDSRAKSQAFVDSVTAYRASVEGQIDGVDFNTFEAEATPNLPEYIWMAQELKRRFSAGFLITSPPAPWKDVDKVFCKGMLAAGAMDYAAPQFYDGPGLADVGYIVSTTAAWVRDVAGGDPKKIVVGFGMNQGAANYSTPAQVKDAWDQIARQFPSIRGAFVWEHSTDKALGWAFGNQIGPVVLAGTTPLPAAGTTTTPTAPAPSTAPGAKVSLLATIGGNAYPLAGVNVERAADALVLYAGIPATTTNQWGAEAVVEKGVVTKLNDRQSSAAMTGTSIPAGAMVLSGHGKARDWLLANAKPGTVV